MHNIHSPEDHTDEVAELKEQYTAIDKLLAMIGFMPVVVCATMIIRTCVERKSGVPVGYGILKLQI